MREKDEELALVEEASLELANRIAASGCPEASAGFAYRAWRPVLIQDLRATRRDSPQWNTDLETLQDLLWALTPRASEEERNRMDALLPSLRYRMWQAQIRAQLPAADIEALQGDFDRLLAEIRMAPASPGAGEATALLGPYAGDETTATLHVSSRQADDEGIVRGAWFEFLDEEGSARRARLTWMSAIQGTCVFKDLAHNRSFAISLDDLREQRALGKAARVEGPGVASSSILGALEDVARERGA
jgi:hypothetical protein